MRTMWRCMYEFMNEVVKECMHLNIAVRVNLRVCVCILGCVFVFLVHQIFFVVLTVLWCTVVRRYLSVVPRLLTQPHQDTPSCSLWVICEARLSFNNWLRLRLEAFISPSLSSHYWPQPAVIVLTAGHVAEKMHRLQGGGKKRTEVKYLFFLSEWFCCRMHTSTESSETCEAKKKKPTRKVLSLILLLLQEAQNASLIIIKRCSKYIFTSL